MKDKENRTEGVIHNVNVITDRDIYLFKEGKHHSLKLNLPPPGAVILKPVEEKESVIP